MMVVAPCLLSLFCLVEKKLSNYVLQRTYQENVLTDKQKLDLLHGNPCLDSRANCMIFYVGRL